MPITCDEIYEDGRKYSFNGQSRIDRSYLVQGTDDEGSARSALEAAAPSSLLGVPRADCSVEAVGVDSFKGSVSYYYRDGFTFETTGGTQKVFASLQTVNAYAPGGGTPPNHYQQIGVTRDSVEGVDISIPTFSFAFTKVWQPSDINDAYITLLFEMTAKVNESTFKIFPPGSCLFLGAAGSQKGGDLYEISYRFAGSRNVTGLTLPSPLGDIGPIDKDGWDYLWIRYRDAVDVSGSNPFMVKAPVGVYVERVYERADFSALGLGS